MLHDKPLCGVAETLSGGMIIQAAVMRQQGLHTPFALSRPFWLEELQLAPPGPSEVLVKVEAAGLCHSDLGTVQGERVRPLPIVGGHEGAGEVLAVGTGVRDIVPGDHVVMTAAAGCNTCPTCARGRTARCDTVPRIRLDGVLPSGAHRLSLSDGSPVHHYSGVSCFATHAVLDQTSLVRIPKAVPLHVAALFGCAVLTGAGAIFNAAADLPRGSVAVIGLGGVGTSALIAARSAGYDPLFGIDINKDKLVLARDLGAEALTPEDATATLSGGVDLSLEVTGTQAGLDTAIALLRRGGTAVCLGLGAYDARYDIPLSRIVGDEKMLRGSLLGSGDARRDIPRYAQMFLAGGFPIDRLICSRRPLADINAALDDLMAGRALRQILVP